MLAGILYERRHTYEISDFGGLATPMPKYAAYFLFVVLASVGLPLLNGFIGEFLVFERSLFRRSRSTESWRNRSYLERRLPSSGCISGSFSAS